MLTKATRTRTRNALIYARFSPRPDADRCDSCDKQIADLTRWCEAEGYTVRLIERDDGESGADDTRQGLERVMRAAKRGDTLVVRDFKRLSRDAHHRFGLAIDLHRRGVKLISVAEGTYQPDNPEWMLLWSILAGVAQYERATIRRSTRTKMRSYQSAGRKMGSVDPYGYREGEPQTVVVRGVERVHRTLVEVPEEQAVIARIRDLAAGEMRHADGAPNCLAIAKLLNAEQVPSRGGVGKWSHKTVKRILQRA